MCETYLFIWSKYLCEKQNKIFAHIANRKEFEDSQ